MADISPERMALARLPPIGSNAAHGISPRANKKYEGLTGPSYTIGGRHDSRYNLPPPIVLKPHQDTKAGGLDTWPAHCQNTSSTSVALTKNKQLIIVDEEAEGKPQMVPKPKFLDQLESFLKKELRSLGVDQVMPSELRLQAYREVFEYLIEDFKTYKPMLSGIKNEYEMMLSHQREHIRQLEPLKQMLVTVSEQCDQKIMALRDQEKQEVVDLKVDNKTLKKKIDELRQGQRALEAQVEKLSEELATEYLKYRDECDARKLLISDINDLRYQQEDNLMSKQSMQDMEEEQDDPVTLKIALKRAREDEFNATKRLNEMIANYGDVIPRRDFENMRIDFNRLQEKLEQQLADFKQLQSEHNDLLDVHKQVLQQRDDYYVEAETLRRTATPRPEWDKCADVVQGGIVRWKQLADSKTSHELMEVLLGEISGGVTSDAAGAEYFDGQGTGESVPRYLQFEGKIRNRRLGKRDTSLLIKDIWREKVASDAEREDGKREKMTEFLYTYLQRRFALEPMVFEWAYNLHDSAQRYSHDDSIGLFWRVLSGETEEALYHANLQTTSQLLNHFTKQDVDKGNPGSLTKDEFKKGVSDYFTFHITDEEAVTLLRAAETELEAKDTEEMEYKNLFMEDDEGKTGPFLEEMRRIQTQHRIDFVDEIKVEIGNKSSISVDDLRKSITIVDPGVDGPDMNRFLLWAFDLPDITKYEDAGTKETLKIIERLKNGNIRRSSKK